jgi:hypothetical protein
MSEALLYKATIALRRSEAYSNMSFIKKNLATTTTCDLINEGILCA